jgi:hypothetical protein
MKLPCVVLLLYLLSATNSHATYIPYTDAQAQAANAAAIAAAQTNAVNTAATGAAGLYMTPTGVNGFIATASANYAPTANGQPVYNATGAIQAPAHAVITSCVLSLGACVITFTGSAIFTSATTYTCVGTDQSSTDTLSAVSNTSGSAIRVIGSLSDTIRVICGGW